MSDLNMKAPIVVGVDGSPQSQDAVDWAVSEASATRRPLRIVHALDAAGERSASERTDATSRTALACAALRALTKDPTLEIISTAVTGDAVPALLRHAEGAELLVVGNRGRGVRVGLLTGSVSAAVAARASCPVVVVHQRHAGDAPDVAGAATDAGGDRVVVACDGSELGMAATRFAFGVAARRGLGLTVLRAWTPPFAGYPRWVLGLRQLVHAERQQLLAALSADRHEFPQVEIELTLVRDKDNHHGRALIEESTSSALVVVGSHGHGGFSGLLFDDACQSVLQHASCPVAVVKLQPGVGVGSHDTRAHTAVRSVLPASGPRRALTSPSHVDASTP